MIKIGNKNIKTNIMLAPMAGCTDLSFRLIAREVGAKFCFFEMTDTNSLVHKNPKTLEILKTIKKDAPIAAQLVGADPDTMLKAAEKLITLANISFLDINSACPAKKITRRGAGAALLNNANKLCKIIKKLSSSLPVPITIKIRIGYAKTDLKKILALVKKCEESGVSAIFVHGRTRSQGYAGEIDYKSIKAIKKAVKIPVIGSGNIFSPQMAQKMFQKTGCDGILVARGALGNPWIFKQIDTYLKTQELSKPLPNSQKLKILKKHLMFIDKYRISKPPAKIGIMRKVTMWYLKGVPNAGRMRYETCKAKTLDELKNIATCSLK